MAFKEKNSMLYWFPRIRGLPIPQPKTEIVEVGDEMAGFDWLEGGGLDKWLPAFKDAAYRIGYPLFIRTDQASYKHNWKKAAFVKSEEELKSHVAETVEFNYLADMMGLQCRAMVFREYVEMASEYTAFFGDMPVNPERRYFIENGEIVCRHPYWLKEAIEACGGFPPSIQDWRAASKRMNKQGTEEIALLTKYARLVAAEFDSAMSVDFCKARDGRWMLIDMAQAGQSYHPPDCPNAKRWPYFEKERWS